MPIVSDTTPGAIESGSSWNGFGTTGAPVIVTFSFLTALPVYDTSIGGFTQATVDSFSQFTPQEKTQALAALNQWAAASGIVFVEVAPGQGDITFGNVDFGTTTTTSVNGDYRNAGGIGFYPFGSWSYYTGNPTTGFGFTSDLNTGGDVYMNANDVAANGTVDLGTLLHEIGHALGLKHTDQIVYDPNGGVHDDVLDPTHDASTITIMSKTGDAANAANPSLFALDQSAAADLYGPAGTGAVVTSSASGVNSVSSWSWDVGANTLTQTAVSADETIHGTSVDDVIYGYDYGGATPTSGHITLYGLDGVNTLYAGSGNTSLYGGPGQNTLVGGVGDDSFYVYSNQTTVTDAYTSGNNTYYAIGVNATLPTNVNTLNLSGAGLTGVANAGNDALFGDGFYSSTLIAGAGDDYMVGGGAGDTLVVGTGYDLMYGGAGANRFVFAPGDAPLNNAYGLTTIGDFKPGTDKLDFSAFADAGHPLSFVGSAPLTAPGQIRVFSANGATYVAGDVTSAGGADFEVQLNGAPAVQASDLVLTSPAVCFVSGARIRTARGDIAVEDLKAGDLAITRSGERRKIVWIGHRRIDCARSLDPASVLPVRVRAGAFGENLPDADLWLSPGHSVCLDMIGEVLAPVGQFVNGASIVQETVESVTYWHVELESHDILLANNLPTESYIDVGNRAFFAEGVGTPDGAVATLANYCRPFLQDELILNALRRRVLARAATQGWKISNIDDNGEMRLLVDGAVIEPSLQDQIASFAVPAGAKDITLCSLSFTPKHFGDGADFRALGISIRAIDVETAGATRAVPLDDPALGEGFHALERGETGDVWRWTNGRARIPAPLLGGSETSVALKITFNDVASRAWRRVEAEPQARPTRRPWVRAA